MMYISVYYSLQGVRDEIDFVWIGWMGGAGIYSVYYILYYTIIYRTLYFRSITAIIILNALSVAQHGQIAD
jgi:hypothetical protein